MCCCLVQGHTGPVFAVAVSPDGRWLATGSDDTTAKVWDLESRACVKTLEVRAMGPRFEELVSTLVWQQV